jgi:hypothetical protein
MVNNTCCISMYTVSFESLICVEFNADHLTRNTHVFVIEVWVTRNTHVFVIEVWVTRNTHVFDNRSLSNKKYTCIW